MTGDHMTTTPPARLTDAEIEAYGLSDARQTTRFGVYVSEAWARRRWVWYVAMAELRSRQINSLLGNLWHVLSPLLQVGVFFLIFGLILEIDRGVDNFLAYLAVGVFVFGFTQKTVTSGGKSMVKYRKLMQIISFPRALIPITTSITEAIATIPAYVVMFVLIMTTGETPKLSWLYIIPFFFLQWAFSTGLAFITARAVSRVYDIQQVLPFVFRLFFYGSGVLFNVNAFLEGKSWRWLFELNPLYCFIEINRSAIVSGRPLDLKLVVIALAWTVSVSIIGVVWFRRAEDSYGQV